MKINDIEWHDGVLDDIHVKGNGEIRLSCHLYPSNNAKIREQYIFHCVDVVSLASSLDVHALLRNKKAGNVNDGRVEYPRKGVSVLKLFLSDGYIELTATKIDVIHEATGSSLSK